MGIRTSARGPSAGAAPSRSTAAPPSLADYAFPEPWNTSLRVPLGLEPRVGGRHGGSQVGAVPSGHCKHPPYAPGAQQRILVHSICCACCSGRAPAHPTEGRAEGRKELLYRLEGGLRTVRKGVRRPAGSTKRWPGVQTPGTPPAVPRPAPPQRRPPALPPGASSAGGSPGPARDPTTSPRERCPSPRCATRPPRGRTPGPGAVLERAPYNGCRSRSSAPGGGTLKTSSKVARNHRGAACALLSGPAYHESSWL